MGLLDGSRLATLQITSFVKQDTAALFQGDSNLRKFANTMTTIGAKANQIYQGGVLKRPTSWLDHVNNHRAKYGGSYKQALKDASKSYKK